MADFSKKDLIDAIEDTVRRELSTGQKDKNRISDLATMIKTAIENNSADEEIKALAKSVDGLKTLFSKVSENVAKQTAAVEKSSSSGGKSKAESMAEQLALRNAKDRDTIAVNTFKTRMAEQLNLNKASVKAFITSAEFQRNSSVSSAFIGNIAKTVNSSVSRSMGGPGMDATKSQALVAKALEDMIIDINRKQKGYTDLNIKASLSLFDKASIAINNSVIGSMIDSTKRMRNAVNTLYGGIKEQVDFVFSEEKKNLIDPLVNATQSIGNAAGMQMFKTKEKKMLGVADESKNILKEMLRTQKKQLGISERDELIKGRAEKDKKGGGITGFLMYLAKVFLAGAALGAIVGTVVIQFNLIYKALKLILKPFGIMSVTAATSASLFARSMGHITKWFNLAVLSLKELSVVKFVKQIVDIYKQIGAVQKVISMLKMTLSGLYHFGFVKTMMAVIWKIVEDFKVVGNFFGTVSKAFRGLGNIIIEAAGPNSFIAKSVGIIAKGFGSLTKLFASSGTGFIAKVFSWFSAFNIFKLGFLKGLKWLAWPLQIVLSLFDFVKGFFQSEESSFIGKVADGLKQVVIGFLELPLQVLGWVWDKTLGLFGVESKDTGDKLVGYLRTALNFILKPFTWIGSIISGTIDWFINNFMRVWDIWDVVKGGIGSLSKIAAGFKIVFLGAFNTIFAALSFFIGFFTSKEKSFFGRLKSGLMAAIESFFKFPIWIITTILGWFGVETEGILQTIESELSGLLDYVLDPIKDLFNIIGNVFKFIWNVVTMDFEAAGENVSQIVDSIVDYFNDAMGLIARLVTYIPNLVIDAFQWLYDKMKGWAEGTMFEPVFELLDSIGEFIMSVVEWVKNKIKDIPLVGDLFKSEAEKNKEKDTEDQLKIEELRKESAEALEKAIRIESGVEKKGWFGSSAETLRSKGLEKSAAAAELEAGIAARNKKPAPAAPAGPPRTGIQDESPITTTNGKTPTMPASKLQASTMPASKLQAPTFEKPEYKAPTPKTAPATGGMGLPGATTVAGSTKYDDQINSAAQKYGVSPDLVKAVMKQESGFNPNAVNKGSGAAGLMQFMPATAKDMGITDRLDPAQSIDGGAKYLAQLSKRFGGDTDKTLAAYNWGMGNVEKKGMGAMPAETRDYLKKVKGNMPVEIAKAGAPIGLGGTVGDEMIAKSNVAKRQMDQSRSMQHSMSELGKSVSKREDTPVVLNTGGGGSPRGPEPPEDIESMSIMWLNKSWGLG